jgi:hypothetical protein
MSMVAARIYVLKASIVQLRWQVEWRPSSWQKTATQKLEKVARKWEKKRKKIKQDQGGSSSVRNLQKIATANVQMIKKNVVSFTMDHMNGSL